MGVRTVWVQDTLPPVITLHVDKVHDSADDAETRVTQPSNPGSQALKNKLAQKGKPESTSPNNVYNKNPAYDVLSNGVGNPFLKSTIPAKNSKGDSRLSTGESRVQNIDNSFVKDAATVKHGDHNGLYPNASLTLMAEQQGASVNAWAIGAVASAVSGLALLVAAARKRPEITVEV